MTAVEIQNPQLASALEQARARFAERRPRTRAVHCAAAEVMPGGNTRTILYHNPFPIRILRGEGADLFDLDGHRYFNLLGEYTAGVFGHSHVAICDSLARAVQGGLNLSAHTMAEADFARKLQERFPTLERLRFTNSGTEANLLAIATAKQNTGRGKVMIFSGSYHGSLLQFGAGGSPINVPHTYLVGNYNDPEEAERLIDLHGEDLACVIVEPMLGSGGSIPATPAFLTRLRDATTRAGTVLIFDEVMTSRFGRQGAGAMYGIAPDMMTLGKWVGGGMPIGVFGGRKRLMDIFDPSAPSFLAHPGTFNNNTLTMHAGQAALDQAFTSDIAEALHYRGDKLREQINVLCQKHDAPFQATGAGSLMTIHAVRGEITSPRDLTRGNDGAKELLFLDLLDMGFYIARRGFIALSVVIEDHHLQAFGDALEQILHERASVFATVEASSYQ